VKAKFLIAALLISFSCSAHAKWTFLFRDKGNTYYVDFSTISTVSENVSRAWILLEPSKPVPVGNANGLSLVIVTEYDCNIRFVRNIYSSLYPQMLGQGKPLHTEKIDEAWRPVQPNSIESIFGVSFCGANK
jgi:hypothetical protein